MVGPIMVGPAVILPAFLLVLGIVILYLGAEGLVRGSARLAADLGVAPIIVGLTVVSLGTSAPELVVCVLAALEGSGDLAMGNALGSNLANLGLVLGATALIRPLDIADRVVVREIPIMLVLSVLLYPLILDLELGRWDGAGLLVLLATYLGYVYLTADGKTPEVLVEREELLEPAGSPPAETVKDIGLVATGTAGVMLGGKLIVDNAILLAASLGVSEMAVGLSVVAVGTSLPELATSLVAAVRQETDIAVGNIIGSNIFNLTAVLGGASLAHPLEISRGVLVSELPAVLILSVLLVPVAASGAKIRRWEGGLLLFTYLALAVWVFT